MPFFGVGKDKDALFWMALMRQALVGGYLSKEIETYGVIHITDSGNAFIKAPTSFRMTEDHKYETTPSLELFQQSPRVVDAQLMKMLLGLRKKWLKTQKFLPMPFFRSIP